MTTRWTTLDGKVTDLRKRLGFPRRQVSRAGTIATHQVDPNNQAAQDWAASHEGTDK